MLYRLPEDQTQFVSVDQLAADWGVARSTVMRWIGKNKIPFEQPGGKGGAIFIPRWARPVSAVGWPEGKK